MEHKNRCRELSDPIKCNDICITEVPEDEERKEGAENLLEEIIAEYFPNLGKEYNESHTKGHEGEGKEEEEFILNHNTLAQ